jgi:hypothetical protein
MLVAADESNLAHTRDQHARSHCIIKDGETGNADRLCNTYFQAIGSERAPASGVLSYSSQIMSSLRSGVLMKISVAHRGSQDQE